MLQVSAVAGLGNLEMGSPAVGLAAAWLGWETTRATRQRVVGVKHLPRAGQAPGARLPVCPHPASRPGNDGVAQLQPWSGLGAGDQQPKQRGELALNWNLRGQNASVLQATIHLFTSASFQPSPSNSRTCCSSGNAMSVDGHATHHCGS